MPKVPCQRKLGQIGDIYLSPQRVFVQKEFFFCYNLMYVFSDWFAKLSTTGKRYSGISLMQLWALH